MFESSIQQQVSMTSESPSKGPLNGQFFACFEDSSFIYQHRKRPRSGESPFDSSPASSTTTTDSMLTNSLNSFSDSSRSSSSRGSCRVVIRSSSSSSGNSSLSRGSKSLSPPPLTFNLSSTTYSPSPLTNSSKSCKRADRADCHRSEQRRFRGNDENEPRACQPIDLHDRTHLKKASPVSSSSSNQIKPIHEHTHQQQVDEKVFLNLVHRERRFEATRRQAFKGSSELALSGQSRHSLLSWMLHICEHQQSQDEIFPLATIILDDFLRLNPVGSAPPPQDLKPDHRVAHHYQQPPHQPLNEHSHCQTSQELDLNHHRRFQSNDSVCEPGEGDGDNPKQPSHSCDSLQRELEQRQLLLFAACSLLLATKLRQTPRLYIETLIEFSRFELPIELSRGEILDCELLILSTLKWDLAALVTPNEFLQELLARKCKSVLLNFMTNHVSSGATLNRNHHHYNTFNGNQIETTSTEHRLSAQEQHELADRVERHTQTLLELCLMDPQLSQYSSSVLAMSSMAVAINGLCKTNNNNNGANGNVVLREIVAQINETTNKVNELKLMIDVAEQIEKYVEVLLQKTNTCQSSTQINQINERSSSD